MAGGGVKAGIAYGETDEWGYKVVKDRVEMHDLHATFSLARRRSQRLTVRFGGRDMQLTDVHGESSLKFWREATGQEILFDGRQMLETDFHC